VNPQHLRAFIWLHWRLRAHQWRRAGALNEIVLAMVAGAVALLSVTLFGVFFFLGRFELADTEPAALMYVWDGVVVAFVFFWAMGVLADLQRSEALSLQKFLHLPVSVAGVFVLNSLSSLVSFSLILFVPVMLGLSLGLVFGRGLALLLLLPAVAAFLLMVTAVTYQFQGWLASLMVNKRRRRTIIVLVTAAFVLIAQLPNLVNVFIQRNLQEPPDSNLVARRSEEEAELNRALHSGEISRAEYQQRRLELRHRRDLDTQERDRQEFERVARTAWYVNLVLPPGWLPLTALGAAEGSVLPALLAIIGPTLIGAASLRRAYRTTLRMYTGQYTATPAGPSRHRDPASSAVSGVRPGTATARAPATLLERRLPVVSEHAAAIALAGWRSLLRAPEAKMMLLSPVIMLAIFGAMFLRSPMSPPDAARPLMAFGGMAMMLFSLVQFAGNLFGFDRNGFRALVLCPARRADILLGKNLALAPAALVLDIVAIAIVQTLFPLRVDHALALLPQWVSMYLLFCLLTNWLSIRAPMRLSTGTLRPAQPTMIMVVLHIVMVFLLPLALAPALLPLAVEYLAEAHGWTRGVPVCLILSVVAAAAMLWLYHKALTYQGKLLQAREQRILDTVSTKAE
jgi:hypothetical protein